MTADRGPGVSVKRAGALTAAVLAAAAACSPSPPPEARSPQPTTPSEASPSPTGRGDRPPRRVALAITDVVTGLDTVWSLAWDPRGRLWFTERSGRLTRAGGPSRTVGGVVENGEGGLMGLEIDDRGRFYVMYTSATDNRVVRLRPDGSQEVLVSGIEAAPIHDGGRIRLGPDGALYASTGDAGVGGLSQERDGLNGKLLRIDTGGGTVSIFSRGHRNAQGLCFDGRGRLLATEHGPDFGDEINVVTRGFDGGWPRTSGNGIHNYTPTIAPAGCAWYDDPLIPQWRGSLLFVTLKDQTLRRLEVTRAGEVVAEQVLYRGRFGRLRDVAVGPDGAVYLATSNRDGRGSPRAGDDRIVRIAPQGS